MNGEELYQCWVDANDEFNIGVDSWYELTDDDRAVWERMASNIVRDAGL